MRKKRPEIIVAFGSLNLYFFHFHFHHRHCWSEQFFSLESQCFTNKNAVPLYSALELFQRFGSWNQPWEGSISAWVSYVRPLPSFLVLDSKCVDPRGAWSRVGSATEHKSALGKLPDSTSSKTQSFGSWGDYCTQVWCAVLMCVCMCVCVCVCECVIALHTHPPTIFHSPSA